MRTAMQILIDELNQTLNSGLYPSTWNYSDAIVAVRDIAESMLDIEKEQIVKFTNSFYDDCVTEGGSLNTSAEQYYNQTYNQNK